MNCGWVRRQENLRAALLAAHVIDIGAHAVAIAEHFARDQLVAADNGFATAQIDDHIAIFDALDGAVDDLADAVEIFVIHALALGIAHLLHDHLLGRLGGDAPEFDRRQRLGQEVADLGGRVLGQRLLQRDLAAGLLDFFDDFQQPPQPQLARARIDFGLDFGFGAVAGLGGLFDRVLHGFDHHHAVDRFFAGDGVCDLQQLESVRANGHLV